MAKSKKSDSKKDSKDKDLKASKPEKSGKEKKVKKKEKAEKAEAAPKPARKAAKPAAKAAAAQPVFTFTMEEISLRAYFIAERRQAMGWPGDSTSDWVEAERQLKAEAARKARQ